MTSMKFEWKTAEAHIRERGEETQRLREDGGNRRAFGSASQPRDEKIVA